MAVELVAKLHGELLRSLVDQTGEHFEGLEQAARVARQRKLIPNRLARKATLIDHAFTINRHITTASSAACLRAFSGVSCPDGPPSPPSEMRTDSREDSSPTASDRCTASTGESDDELLVLDSRAPSRTEASEASTPTAAAGEREVEGETLTDAATPLQENTLNPEAEAFYPATHSCSAPGGSTAASALPACGDFGTEARLAEVERQLASRESRFLALLSSVTDDKQSIVTEAVAQCSAATTPLLADLKSDVVDNVSRIIGDSQAQLGESLKTDFAKIFERVYDGKFDLVHSVLKALQNKLNEAEHSISELRLTDGASSGLLQPATPHGALPGDTAPETADGKGTADAETAATLRQRAEGWKLRGNEKLKENTTVAAREAVEFFTTGLEVECHDDVLNAQLYGNRAHVRINKLQQYEEAVKDCRKAINLDPKNVKNYWRAAKASMFLELLPNAIEFCELGLKQKANDDDLLLMLMICTEKNESSVEETHAQHTYDSQTFSSPDGALPTACSWSDTSSDPGGNVMPF